MNKVAAVIVFASLSAFASAALAQQMNLTRDTDKGKVLVDGKGMTLYTFDKDSSGKSACNDACAQNWPPFVATANAKPWESWTIVNRDDGSKMWAYKGKPLYTWKNDKAPGDTSGDGANGDTWHVAKP